MEYDWINENSGKRIRLSRVSDERTGKMVIVPMDHTAVTGPIKGLENSRDTIKKVVAGGATAIMAQYGTVKYGLKEYIGKAGCIYRITTSSSQFRSFEDMLSAGEYMWPTISSVEEALRMGADGVGMTITWGGEKQSDLIERLGRIVDECDRWNMPLLIESLPIKADHHKGVADVKDEKIACRTAAEFGADVIKTYWTGSKETFKEVVDGCQVPIVLAGGEKGTDRDFLEKLKGAMDAGAMGCSVGRNIWQHPDPTAMTRAVCKIILEGASVGDAMKELT